MSDDANKPLPDFEHDLTEVDGSGRPDSALCRAKNIAADIGRAIAAQFSTLTPRERRHVLTAFRSALIHRRKAGKRPKPEITAAYEDWRNGMRGPAFYLKHIPNYSKMGRWHRESEERRLKEAMRSRERRSRRTGADNQQSVSAA